MVANKMQPDETIDSRLASTQENLPSDAPALDDKSPNLNAATKVELQVDAASPSANDVTVVSIIGEFGFYQLSLALIAFIRYTDLAMMTNTGPLLAPRVDFSCKLNDSFNATDILLPKNTTLDQYLDGACTLNLKSGEQYQCTEWTYNTTVHGITLTDTFDLVCKRDKYRSAFQSIVSTGVVIAAVVWGAISDKSGRRNAMNIAFMLSLISGIISCFAGSLQLYAISRAVCTFSDLGLVVSLSTIVVELLGNKYRGATCIIVYTGWAFGVMIMPWITEYFRDFRKLMLFTVVNHLLTLPWLITVQESIRWSLVNGKFEEARQNLRTISRWNLKGDEASLKRVDEQFNLLKRRFEKKQQKREDEGDRLQESSNILSGFESVCKVLMSGFSKVGQLFVNKELAQSTLTVIWITFNSELLYMIFIMINSDIGGDVKLNYAIGGAMETLATILAIGIIAKVSRKLSLFTCLTSISLFTFILAFTHDNEALSVWILNLTKFAISTHSSLLYVATTEIFPTNLRQTGFGLTGTIGSLGAVVAPFIRTELADMIGITRVLLLLMCMPLTAASIIPFFLRETKDVELPDDVEEMIEKCKTEDSHNSQLKCIEECTNKMTQENSANPLVENV